MSSGLLTRSRTRPAGVLEPMDPRLAARRIEVARDRGRRRRRRLIALLAVTLLVLAGVGISRSSALDVDRVRVAGAERSGADLVRERAGISRGRAMTSVDLGAATRRVESLPWVSSARLTRAWPGTVRVEVTERVAAAVAGAGPGAVLVDRHGRILGPAGAADARTLPQVGPDPVEGPGSLLPAARRPLVALLDDLPVELRRRVRTGVLTSGGYGLVLDDGIRVELGAATRLRAKAEAIVSLLDQTDRPIATIDISVPGAAALTFENEGGA
ncbi:hypothetical protein BH10ACT1_BH10ACT1_31770 [soil metagenome]